MTDTLQYETRLHHHESENRIEWVKLDGEVEGVSINGHIFTPSVFYEHDQEYSIVTWVFPRSWVWGISIKELLDAVNWSDPGPTRSVYPGAKFHSEVRIIRSRMRILLERTYSRDV